VTVAWVTPPNSTLSSGSSPIAFRVVGESEVPAISVTFQGRPEERAYRQGTFLYPYDESTRTLGDFTLRRRGGWPLDLLVHVDECVTGGPVGDQVVDGSGNRVIDGSGNRVVP
jgi:hypothetical protein